MLDFLSSLQRAFGNKWHTVVFTAHLLSVYHPVDNLHHHTRGKHEGCVDALQVFQVPSDYAGIINPRCSLEPNHSDGVQSLCLSGTSLFSGGRDMAIMKWDLTDQPQLRQVLSRHRTCFAVNLLKDFLDEVPGKFLKGVSLLVFNVPFQHKYMDISGTKFLKGTYFQNKNYVVFWDDLESTFEEYFNLI